MHDFTHFNEQGRARMVNVGDKEPSCRTATAAARVLVGAECFDLIRNGVVYDLGRIFPESEMGGFYMIDPFSDSIHGGLDWVSARKANNTILLSSLKSVVKKFQKHASR